MKKTQVRGRGGGNYRFKPSKVDLKDWFPIEPGFSVTIHKAQVSPYKYSCAKTESQHRTKLLTSPHNTPSPPLQGRTIKKVILSISEHPNQLVRMTWEGLYVALSRV